MVGWLKAREALSLSHALGPLVKNFPCGGVTLAHLKQTNIHSYPSIHSDITRFPATSQQMLNHAYVQEQQ